MMNNPLTDATQEQKKAIDPNFSIWVKASAGSGKTKLLIDRILSLLLSGNQPKDLLVMTFTRAAAAEIKQRLDSKLAEWTVLTDNKLWQEITAVINDADKISAEQKKKKLALARGLFLQMMDEKQNLLISTIHGFCQQLLGFFPIEAGVPFGFRIAEEQETKKLQNIAIQTILLRQDEEISPLLHEASDYWQKISGIKKNITALLDDPLSLRQYQQKGQYKKSYWQEQRGMLSPDVWEKIKEQKAALLAGLTEKEFKKNHKPKSDERTELESINHQLSKQESLKKSFLITNIALEVLNHYEKMKFENGILDYDDLIIKTGDLLELDGMHAWVQYKMAGHIKHLLLDEAQDTSRHQWRVIDALINILHTAQGKKGKGSFLIVGDGKQSIYGFQGANLDDYQYYNNQWQKLFGKDLKEVPISVSFRSGKHILSLVNRVFADQELLLPLDNHRPFHQDMKSMVVVKKKRTKKIEDSDKEFTIKNYVEDIASDIKSYIDKKSFIDKNGETRPITADDVMVLLRKRKPLQLPLVRALKRLGIAVAGSDQVALADEWLVKELLNVGRAITHTRADLFLANLLVSSFCGLSHGELEKIALNRLEKKQSLYQALKEFAEQQTDDWWQKLLAWFDKLVASAHKTSAFGFYYQLLEFPCPVRHQGKGFALNGHMALLQNWGTEEEETLSLFFDALLLLERNRINDLPRSIHGILNQTEEMKKNTASHRFGVRIITCHGAKGLEAPVVFLPDYQGRKEGGGISHYVYGDEESPHWFWSKEEVKKDDELAPLVEAKEKSDKAEDGRLLYVALTRAKNLLVVSGFWNRLGEDKKDAWYDYCHRAITSLSSHNDEWGNFFYGDLPDRIEEKGEAVLSQTPLPAWVHQPLPKKTNLFLPDDSQKIVTQEKIADQKFERGLMIHRLLEMAGKRKLNRTSMDKLLAVEFSGVAETMREEAIAEVEKILMTWQDLPNEKSPLPHDWQMVFYQKEGLFLEQDIMGAVNHQPILGRVDRMLITKKSVLIVDYKTYRQAPKKSSAVLPAVKKQMAGYRQLLKQVYRDKDVRTALFFTQDQSLLELTDEA